MKMRINAREYAWGDVSIVLFGQPVLGIRGIDYNQKKNKEALYAAGRYPKSIQHGRRESEGTLTILQSELIALNKSAIAAVYTDILDVDMDIQVAYADASGITTIDRIVKASFTELPQALKEGDMNQEIAIPFVALYIEFNITKA